MRIVAGEHRGRRLFAPKNREIRPTADRVRQSLFDVLGPLEGARVLDLFAGSGALGLEALSRGAAHALFVDRAPQALDLVARNVALVGEQARCEIWRSEAGAALNRAAKSGLRFSLVFLDPPYAAGLLMEILAHRAFERVLETGARVVVETGSDGPDPLDDTAFETWTLTDDRRYGGTRIRLLTRS